MAKNPFQRVIDEAGRQLLGKTPGANTRNRSAGNILPGTGAQDAGNSAVLTDDNIFTIGESAIGGDDEIG